MNVGIGSRWEHFDHMADIGIRGIGDSREQAFEQAALALTAVITDPTSLRCDIQFDFECIAEDDEMLLVDWLNRLISEMSSRRMLFGRFNVQIRDHHLHGSAWGEPADPARHHPAVEVKGATLTELRVACDQQGQWSAQCVVDV